MAFSWVQTSTGVVVPANQTTAFTTNVTCASDIVVGDRALCLLAWWADNASTPSITTVSDSGNGNWDQLASVPFVDGSFNAILALYSVPVAVAITAGSNIACALNPGASAVNTGGELYVLDYSGLSAAAGTGCVDVSSTDTSGGGSSTGPSTAAVTPGDVGELVLRLYADDGWSATWSAAPSGTARVNRMSSNQADVWMSEASSVASLTTDSGTLSTATTWAMATVVVKLTAGPAGSTGLFPQV